MEGDLLNIVIRKIPDEVVTRLDRKAKEKGMSREELLREVLLVYSLDDEIKKINERNEIMINRLLKIINLNTKVMSKFMQENCISYEEVFEDE